MWVGRGRGENVWICPGWLTWRDMKGQMGGVINCMHFDFQNYTNLLALSAGQKLLKVVEFHLLESKTICC